MMVEKQDLTVASGAAVSSTFQVYRWAMFVGLGMPAMDDGVIGLVAEYDGTNYYPILDPADGQDVVICASGSDPAIIDITDFLRFAHNSINFRLTCAQQSADRTLKLFFRG